MEKKSFVTKERTVCFVLGAATMWAAGFTIRLVRGYRLLAAQPAPAPAQSHAA